MRKILFCYLVVLLLSLSTVAAQELKDEWRDKNAAFNQFKTIVILRPNYDSSLTVDDEISRKKLENLLDTAIWQEKLAQIRWLNQNQLEQKIGSLTQTDMVSLKQSDPAAFAALVTENAPVFADAQLTITVRQWGYTQEYVPEKWERHTEYRSVPVKVIETDARGRRTVTTHWEQVPFEEMRLVPAHYKQISHAGLALTLTNYKNGEKVWMLLDLRDAEGAKAPIDITERIIKRATERYASLLN